MSFNIDELKKKIIYRSNYRGTKEMDKLLGKFVKKYINELEEDDLIDLDKLLNIDRTIALPTLVDIVIPTVNNKK